MGGFMTQRMAIESNLRYAAFGSVAGTYGTGLVNPNPGRAIPLVHFNGTADDRVNWKDNNPILPFEHFVGDMIDFWVANNHCDTTSVITHLPDVAEDGYTVDHLLYGGGADGSVVEVFKVNGAGHVWLKDNADINYANELWKIFSRYSLSQASVNDVWKSTFQIFPNPAQDRITIVTDNTTDRQIVVYDLNGKIMLKPELPLYKQVDISCLPVGLYLVRLDNQIKKLAIIR